MSVILDWYLCDIDGPTEIQDYLEQEYVHIPQHSDQFDDDKLKVKDYAVRCNREHVNVVLDFIGGRQSTYLKIWILMNTDQNEVAFVMKQIHAKNITFFKRSLKFSFVEFYILKPDRDIPNKIKDFLATLKGTLIYNLIQNNKGGSDFAADVRELENFSKILI